MRCFCVPSGKGQKIAGKYWVHGDNLEDSQIVAIGGPVKDAICKVLHWKPNMYQKGLQALREAGAIRQRSRVFTT